MFHRLHPKLHRGTNPLSGKGIVDAQNVNARLVVDAQNSINGNLCMIYNVVGGSCGRMIGPLEEGQLVIPFDFYVPEDHVSLSRIVQEKIELMEDKMEKILAVEGKVDTTEVKVSWLI